MKAFIIIGILVLILGVGGYFGYAYFLTSPQSTNGQENFTAESDNSIKTVRGLLIKVANPKDDYTHTIKTATVLVRAASYTVTLDEYVGKNVEVTGQNSGNTLFVDTITELK